MDQQKSKKGLLVVSFGTSYPETRKVTIEAIENDLARAFPERRLVRAWTSGMIRRKVEKAEGLHILSVAEALERMAASGITDVLVQPTHLLNGEELERTRETVCSFAGRFENLSMGEPLLSCPEDIAALARAVEEIYGDLPRGELLALMGHGSAAMTFPAYEKLEERFRKDGYPNICIGTVECTPGIAPVLERVRRDKRARVHLAPLLVVAGDHALNDMSGDDPDSWKNQIVREGAEVVCHVNGLGEYEAVRALYVAHARKAYPITGEAAV